MYYNIDCIEGAKQYLQSNSVDLIITDPPYGIEGDKLDRHYNRNESYIIDGYVEIPEKEYPDFSLRWIKEAHRVLRPGGSIYIISGYTNLRHILNAVSETELKEINHIIWKFNFGVYTRNKFVSSHYHIIYCIKPGGKSTFNTNAFYGDSEKDANNNSLNYQDREDVWNIKRENKHGEIKNKNELPTALLTKMIMYSSNRNDLVCDFFLGSFSTAKVAVRLGRRACGFEINANAYNYQINQMNMIQPNDLINSIRMPPVESKTNRGKKITHKEAVEIIAEFKRLARNGSTKKSAINKISQKYGRGYWSILNIIERSSDENSQPRPIEVVQI